jgi:hypothetical protein
MHLPSAGQCLRMAFRAIARGPTEGRTREGHAHPTIGTLTGHKRLLYMCSAQITRHSELSRSERIMSGLATIRPEPPVNATASGGSILRMLV